MEVRSLGYSTDLMVRTLEGSLVTDRGDYLVIRSPHNPDFRWGNFLLLRERPAPGQLDQLQATFAAEFPEASHVTLGVDVAEADATDGRELTAAGFTMTQSAVLTCGEVYPPARQNTEATYRLLSGDDDWQQSIELRVALYEDGTCPGSAYLQGRAAAQRAITEAGHGWWFGAFVNGKLLSQLGVVTGTTDLARYQDVETHPDARRQGLASTLLWHSAQHARSGDSERTLVIVADPQDAAIRMYQSAGFRPVQTQLGFDRASDG